MQPLGLSQPDESPYQYALAGLGRVRRDRGVADPDRVTDADVALQGRDLGRGDDAVLERARGML